jgi:hypothetical protein
MTVSVTPGLPRVNEKGRRRRGGGRPLSTHPVGRADKATATEQAVRMLSLSHSGSLPRSCDCHRRVHHGLGIVEGELTIHPDVDAWPSFPNSHAQRPPGNLMTHVDVDVSNQVPRSLGAPCASRRRIKQRRLGAGRGRSYPSRRSRRPACRLVATDLA